MAAAAGLWSACLCLRGVAAVDGARREEERGAELRRAGQRRPQRNRRPRPSWPQRTLPDTHMYTHAHTRRRFDSARSGNCPTRPSGPVCGRQTQLYCDNRTTTGPADQQRGIGRTRSPPDDLPQGHAAGGVQFSQYQHDIGTNLTAAPLGRRLSFLTECADMREHSCARCYRVFLTITRGGRFDGGLSFPAAARHVPSPDGCLPPLSDGL